MPKSLPAQVVTQIDATTSQPVLLFELELDAGTLRYCAANTNLVFPTGGNTYTAQTIQVGAIESTAEGQINRVSLQFDNVSGEWTSYTNGEKFDGKQIVIKKVYRDALGSAIYYNELFRGYLEEVKKITRFWCEMSAVSGKPLGRQMLLDVYQERCNHLFGYGQCNYDGYADLTSLKVVGTADSGTTSTLTDAALTQADDYWNHGQIQIIINSKTYYRKVADFDAGTDTITLDVPLPVSISNGDSYIVYKGCDQTWKTCSAQNAWGPSSDNSANFGGFIHINRISTDPDEMPTPLSIPTNIHTGMGSPSGPAIGTSFGPSGFWGGGPTLSI